VKSNTKDKEDDWGDETEMQKDQRSVDSQTTAIQVKGDTRYLVQKMGGGTLCDLTNRLREIEIQYHCSERLPDHIGLIKEVTTCSYVMVVYTSRLCEDVAFLPPKESKANIIACRAIVPDEEVSAWKQRKTVEAEVSMRGGEPKQSPINIGGVRLGGGKYFGKSGLRLKLPPNWLENNKAPDVEVIASSKGKADDNKVEIISEEKLKKLDIDPEVVEELKSELQKLAGDKGWKLEVVEIPGEDRTIRGVVDADDEDENESKDGEEGSEETYVEAL
jgi:protein OS-9